MKPEVFKCAASQNSAVKSSLAELIVAEQNYYHRLHDLRVSTFVKKQS